MFRWFLFATAVGVLYGSGFVYKEVGPLIYGLISVATLSIPLLLKLGFWKKVLLAIPLLLFRIVGKYLLLLFGRNAFTALMRRYGLIEKRWGKFINSIYQYRSNMVSTWNGLERADQAYLILIFLPIALTVSIVVILVKIVRLKMVQVVLERILVGAFSWIKRRFGGG